MTKLAGTLIAPTPSGAPSSPVAGQIYYNAGTNTLYYYNGTSWITAGTGGEIGYDQITAGVNVTGLSDASQTTIISGTARTYDGGPVIAEFYCPSVGLPAVAGSALIICLFDGATQQFRWGDFRNPSADGISDFPIILRTRFSPSAGSHTYGIRAFAGSTTGTPTILAGPGTPAGTGYPPAYLRFIKAVAPGSPSGPKITSSSFSGGPPSGAADGDIWVAMDVDGASNGINWQFRYNAGSASTYKWEFMGGPEAIRQDSTRTVRSLGTANSWLATPGIGTFTSARSGDYIFEVGAGLVSAASGADIYISVLGAEPLCHLYNNTATINLNMSLSAKGFLQGVSANQVWTHSMYVTNTSNYCADPWFTIKPIRVS
jgi:hypothetical protein